MALVGLLETRTTRPLTPSGRFCSPSSWNTRRYDAHLLLRRRSKRALKEFSLTLKDSHGEAVARQKGYQCLRVLTVDASTAINPVERRPRTHTTVTPSSAWIVP